MKGRIIRNSAKCLKCNDEVVSEFRHDYRTCKCGAIMVDGGIDYLRRGATSWEIFQDTSIMEGDYEPV